MSGRAVVVGCGLIGRRRAHALEQVGARVHSVYDTNRAASVALAASLGSHVLVAESADEALHTADGAVVVVATSHDALVPVAKQAVGAGHHVLLEKPGGVDLEAMQELVHFADSAGLVVRVGFNHRFHPSVSEAHRIVLDGQYGRIMNIRARYGHGGRVGYEREWRTSSRAGGGGELLDQGVHLIDLVRFFAGDAELAFAELRTDFWPVQVEDNAFLALRCRSGAFAWLHASWTEWKNTFSFEIALERAKLELSGLGGSYGVERLTLYEMRPEMGPPDTRSWEWPRADESWVAEVVEMLDAVGGKPGETGATLCDAIANMAIVRAAYEK